VPQVVTKMFADFTARCATHPVLNSGIACSSNRRMLSRVGLTGRSTTLPRTVLGWRIRQDVGEIEISFG